MTKNKPCKKVISDFPNYEVDTNGDIWRGKRGKSIKLNPHKSKQGYVFVSLYKEGVKRAVTMRLHQIVLQTFIGKCPIGMQACHNNGVRDDNRLENLRWDTPKNNNADKRLHGTYLKGSLCPSSKLNEKQVRVIKWCFKNGMEPPALAKYFPVTRQTLGRIKAGKWWKHVTIST